MVDSTGAAAALGAVAAAGLFEGVALFCSLEAVPHYNDGTQDAEEMLRDWRRMFPAAKTFQLRMIALGTAAAAVAAFGLRSDHPRAAAAFGVTAAANAATLGHTLRNMMPLNNRLMAPGQVEAAESQEGIRGLLREWGRLHSVRTALGGLALAASLYGTHALLARKS